MNIPVPRRDPNAPLPQRPYRDSAILYAVLAGVVVALILITGGSLAKALAVAGACFVIATAWTWWRFHERERLDRERP